MDKVIIEGLKVQAHVGVPDAERRRWQPVIIDIVLSLDLRRAGRADNFKATVDYAAVVAEIQQLVRAGQFKLVEAMAEQIAALLLAKFRMLKEVRLRLRKFSVPGTISVGVKISRS